MSRWLSIAPGIVFFSAMLLLLIPGSPTRAQNNESRLFTLLSDLRRGMGLQSLSQSESLRIAAANQARWMTETGLIQHTRPDGNRARDRAAAAGYGSTWISEIIYMSPNPSHIPAWEFWLASSVHYNVLTNPNYENVGIARYSTNNHTAYVMVFGNLSGYVPGPPNNIVSNNDASAPLAPAGLRGLDETGYILHQIQPGETIGDLLLLYGYRDWAIAATIEAINDVDRYSLEVGKILRIPPFDGTWTPVPATEATAINAFSTPLPTTAVTTPTTVSNGNQRPTLTPAPSSTTLPTVLVAETRVLQATQPATPPNDQAESNSEDEGRRGTIIALIVALGVQGTLLLGVGALFLHMRHR